MIGHRHQASYEHSVSSGWASVDAPYGVEHGTCNCGVAVKRQVQAGETSSTNVREWVEEFVSLDKGVN